MLKFSKSQRLLTRIDFNALKKDSQKLIFGNFLLIYKKNSLDFARLGIIVSKKVSKKAVIRNLYKRIIRESFRIHQDKLKVFDYLIIVRHNDAFEKLQFRQNLDKTWQKLTKS